MIGQCVNEEDQIVCGVAGLPECYNVLVTALEASAEVPRLAVVTEHLLQKTKMNSKLNQFSREGTSTHTIKNSKEALYIEALYIASYFSATLSHQRPARRSKSVVQGVTIFTIHKLYNLIHMIQFNLNLTITCMG